MPTPQKKRQFNVYLNDKQKLAVIDVGTALHSRLGPTIRHLVLVGLEAEQRRLGLPVTDHDGMPVDNRTRRRATDWAADVPDTRTRSGVLGAPDPLSDSGPGSHGGGGEWGGAGGDVGQGAAGGTNLSAPSAPPAPSQPMPSFEPGVDPFAHFGDVSDDDVRPER